MEQHRQAVDAATLASKLAELQAPRCLAYHGLAAYSGARGQAVKGYKHGVQALTVAGEICCADKPLGPFGLVVEGYITRAFDRDVWSKVTAGGLRVWDSERWSAGKILPNHQQWCEFAQAHPTLGYCEALMLDVTLQSLWVKRKASRLEIAAVDALSSRYGVGVRVIRSWESIAEAYPPSEMFPD